MKIFNKRELQQIASNHCSDIDFQDFMKLYQDYTKEPFSFLLNNTTFLSDNSLPFRKTYYKNGSKSKQLITKLNKTKLNII